MSNLHAIKRIFWMALGIGSLVVVGGLFTPTQGGAISCGDTLGPGGKFVLTADVGPCPGTGLTVDSAKLEMAGFTVSCSGPGFNGVSVIGTGAVVKNGIVTGCQNGFDIQGSGHRLKGNAAIGNIEKGFEVGGDNNKLRKNSASGNGDEGFDTSGDNNQLKRNNASGNSHNGFDIQSSNNTMKKNIANGNGSHGIIISEGFTGNTVSRSTATGNGDEDLFDENGECASNTWSQNTFGTSDPACIQ